MQVNLCRGCYCQWNSRQNDEDDDDWWMCVRHLESIRFVHGLFKIILCSPFSILLLYRDLRSAFMWDVEKIAANSTDAHLILFQSKVFYFVLFALTKYFSHFLHFQSFSLASQTMHTYTHTNREAERETGASNFQRRKNGGNYSATQAHGATPARWVESHAKSMRKIQHKVVSRFQTSARIRRQISTKHKYKNKVFDRVRCFNGKSIRN